jgi:hypothetical protein
VAQPPEIKETVMNRRFFRLTCMLGTIGTAVLVFGAPLKW